MECVTRQAVMPQSAESKQRLRTRSQKIGDMLCNREFSAECHTERFDCFNSCDTWNCGRWDLDGSSASWRHKDDFDRLVAVQYQIVPFGPSIDICNFFNTRLKIGSWNDKIRVIRIFVHGVAWSDWTKIRGCDDIGCWTYGGTLDNTGQDVAKFGTLITEFRAVRVVSEERLYPVVDMVRNVELGKFIEDSTVAHTVEGFGEI